eukprot:gene2202-2376_t
MSEKEINFEELKKTNIEEYKRLKKIQHLQSEEPYDRKLKKLKAQQKLQAKKLKKQKTLVKNEYQDAKIAIIGAGIGGCSIALSLKNYGFTNVVVYEKDSHFNSRRQGYGLTIQQAVPSLKELGIFEKVKEIDTKTESRYFFKQNGQIKKFYGRTFFNQAQQNKFNLHTSRQDLRYLLINKEELNIKWNHKLKGLKQIEDKVQLEFENETLDVDMVIGADGIYSQVRNLFSSKEMNYLGVMVVLGIVYVDHELLKKTTFETSNGLVRIYTMPFSAQFESTDKRIKTMWQLSFSMDEKEAAYLSKNKKDLKNLVSKLVSNFHSPVPEMINETEIDDLMGTPVFDNDPISLELLQKYSRVTLIGDAFHPMSPFKSQGANRAIIDAMVLAKFLCQNPIEDSITKFEKTVSRVSMEKVLISRNKVTLLHNGKDPSDDISHEHLTILESEGIGSWTKNLSSKIKEMGFKDIGNYQSKFCLHSMRRDLFTNVNFHLK